MIHLSGAVLNYIYHVRPHMLSKSLNKQKEKSPILIFFPQYDEFYTKRMGIIEYFW